MKQFTLTALVAFVAACGNTEVSQLDEAWNQRNNPELMGYDDLKSKYQYTTKFSELPLTAELSEQPWSGDYWATYRGGITYRWKSTDKNWQDLSQEELEPFYSYDLIGSKKELKDLDMTTLSPAEKFDIYSNDYSFTLTNYERQRTQIMRTVKSSDQFDPDFEIPSWEGLCHAWAPATLQYQAPKAVTLTNAAGIEVPFGASDIKALLTYNIHINQAGAMTKFLGQRCNLNVDDLAKQVAEGDITQEEYRAEYRKILATTECNDTNAGAFHLTLANQVGKLNEGFVVDVTRDAEVWNQGVYKYESQIWEESEEVAPTAAPGTVKTVLVYTTMYYVNEVNFSWDGSLGNDDAPEGFKEYFYNLEIDINGDIIGGEWANVEDFYDELSFYPDEKDDRPDFMWKMERKDFVGFFAPLKEIYEQSIAQ